MMLGKYSDGLERDITLNSSFSILKTEVAEVDDMAQVRALADGRTFLIAEVEGQKISATVTVQKSKVGRPFSFHQDIGSIFTRRGCNRFPAAAIVAVACASCSGVTSVKPCPIPVITVSPGNQT